jgi:ribonuclease Z
MKLVFLGTTGYHPNARRHTMCLMLPEIGMVLDAGTGFFRVRDHLATPDLHIFLSHAHLDHVVGLTYLFDVLYSKPATRVVIYGAEKYLTAVREHLFSELLFPVEFAFETQAIDAAGDAAPSFPIPGGGTGTFRWQQHKGGSLGYRFTWPGRSLAYITDTPARPDEVEFFRGVDVLVHECYFPDAMKERAELTNHSYAGAVAAAARDAGVGRLYLVHVNPLDDGPDPVDVPSMRRVFSETHLAEDLMEIDF